MRVERQPRGPAIRKVRLQELEDRRGPVDLETANGGQQVAVVQDVRVLVELEALINDLVKALSAVCLLILDEDIDDEMVVLLV